MKTNVSWQQHSCENKKTPQNTMEIKVPSWPKCFCVDNIWVAKVKFTQRHTDALFLFSEESKDSEDLVEKEESSATARPAKRARTSFTVDQLQVLYHGVETWGGGESCSLVNLGKSSKTKSPCRRRRRKNSKDRLCWSYTELYWCD